ncbi:alpha/beta hydrolase [Haladaptatus sp. DFWS20]|uniref:alpha/beta hydrolase n=1 Tax=Haladaptatus sp. DFWS20 TaxID=3403467 RepID=UPI003EB6CAB8
MSDNLLDPQAATLLDQFEKGVAPPSWTLSVETGRQLLEDLFGDAPDADVEETTDLEIQGPNGSIPLRIYTPLSGEAPYRILVYLHGGGWVRGSVDAYDPMLRQLANESESVLVAIDYRRAPEHPFPVPFEDCYHATAWVAEHAETLQGNGDSVAIGGDSAGGNLSAAVALAARDRGGPDLAHQLLIYPAVNPPNIRWFDSYDENGSGYFLEFESVEWYLDQYLSKEADRANIYAFPLRANDHANLPTVTVLTAGFDPLRDEGFAYADRLENAGISVNHLHYEQQIHGFVNLGHYIDAAEDAIESLAASLRESV